MRLSGNAMADPARRSEITSLVQAAEPGHAPSLDALVALVYDELKVVARRQLAREATGHTLQTTALVHEAYFRLVDSSQVGARGRSYFFGAAASAMRQVLIDHARKRNAAKRDGGALDSGEVRLAVDELSVELLDLDRALERLAELNPRQARVIECRYFGGLSVEETAEALGVSARTVKSDWALSRAWLYQVMRGAGGE